MSKVIKKINTLRWLRLGMLSMLLALLISFGAQESFADSTTFHDDANSLNAGARSNLQSQANGLPSNVANLTSTSATSSASASHFRRSSTVHYSSSRSSSGGFQVWWFLFIVVIAVISFISHAVGRVRTLRNNKRDGIGPIGGGTIGSGFGGVSGYEAGQQVSQNNYNSSGFTAGGSDWGNSDNSSSGFITGDSGWDSNDNSSSGFTTDSSSWSSNDNSGSSGSDWGSSGGSFGSSDNGNGSNW